MNPEINRPNVNISNWPLFLMFVPFHPLNSRDLEKMTVENIKLWFQVKRPAWDVLSNSNDFRNNYKMVFPLHKSKTQCLLAFSFLLQVTLAIPLSLHRAGLLTFQKGSPCFPNMVSSWDSCCVAPLYVQDWCLACDWDSSCCCHQRGLAQFSALGHPPLIVDLRGGRVRAYMALIWRGRCPGACAILVDFSQVIPLCVPHMRLWLSALSSFSFKQKQGTHSCLLISASSSWFWHNSSPLPPANRGPSRSYL